MNYKWPATKHNGYAPWYVILRRLPFVPFFYTSLAITTILVACIWGIQGAHDWYDNQGL